MSETASAPKILLEKGPDAPTLIFDDVPYFGVIPGMGKVTLSVYINDSDSAGGIKQRQIAVAHLRGNALAFAALRDAINSMELMAVPAQGGEQPN